LSESLFGYIILAALRKYMFKYQGLTIEKFNHDTIFVRNQHNIYFDPFRVEMINMPRADMVFISHQHPDHCSPEDLEKVIKSDSLIIASHLCQPLLQRFQQEKVFLKPGEGIDYRGVKVLAVPAYNTNKYRAPGQFFHPRSEGGLGYLIEIDNIRLYFAGDTDVIEEMSDFGSIDLAFLPVSGTYVMDEKEAAQAIAKIRPKVVVPMHYGCVAGELKQAFALQRLTDLAEIRVLN